MNTVKKYFERLYERYNRKEYIGTDPIKFPHMLDGNTEFIAFTAALFAYGNVKAMQNFLGSFFETCGTNPLSLKPNPQNLKYRFQSVADVAEYCCIMKKVYEKYGSLETLFKSRDLLPLEAAAEAVTVIRNEYLPEITQGMNFLFSLPGKSASKRLSMFLRWMIRKDEVDFGIWSRFSPAALHMPLDTHVQRLSEKLGIITEKDKGMKALIKVNAFFKELNPNDPVKYDFALTRLGIAFQCRYAPSELCKSCPEKDLCIFI